MSKVIVVQERMYNVPLRLFVGSYEEYRAYARKKYRFDEDEKQRWFGAFSMLIRSDSGRAEGFIWMPSLDAANHRDVALLAHEILHIVIRILDLTGVGISADNQEPACYLHEYFLGAVLEKYKKIRVEEMTPPTRK